MIIDVQVNILVIIESLFYQLVASSSNSGSVIDGGSGSGTVPAAVSSTVVNADEKVDELVDEEKKDNELSLIDDRPAVGSEYIEEEKDASGKCTWLFWWGRVSRLLSIWVYYSS